MASVRTQQRGRLFLLGLGILFSAWAHAADIPPLKVTITQPAPLELLSPAGDVTGVKEAAVGDTYTFVSMQASQLILRDAQGGLCQIAQNATDYVPPPVVRTPAPTAPPGSTSASSPPASAAPAVATAASTAPPPAPAPSPAPAPPGANSPDDAVSKINQGIGVPLFGASSFWKESGTDVANRLGLKLEDKTKWETAYRRYFYGDKGNDAPAPILGGSAYCIALYADAGDAPTSALIAFTNDGDYAGVGLLNEQIYDLEHPAKDHAEKDHEAKEEKLRALKKQVTQLENAFEGRRQNEQATLTKNLTTLFGDPTQTSFGDDPVTREDATRWDWNGVSLMLTCQPNKYNLLRIIPTELADNHGRTERIPRDEMRAKLSDAVEHRANGDVIITQLPMADQGNKGYCVPATWERVLRYTGVPGDMYTLSRIGNAGFGGGEWGIGVAEQLDDTLHNYGRRAEVIDIDKIDAISLHRYIDEGIPVFWSLNPDGYKTVADRYHACNRNDNWDEWKKILDETRASLKSMPPLPPDMGHQVLIIGYNSDTKEIAWSDPWGRETAEHWMTEEEAERCSLNQFYIITW